MVMNVEIISKEIIKPSSPTPHHLRKFKLSFLDQLAPLFHFPIIWFYDSKKFVDVEPFERSRLLKESLAKTLTHFYPLAGAPINDEFSINCNDKGVDYIQARVLCKQSQAIHNPNGNDLIQLLPFEPDNSCNDFGKEVLLAVQYNIFECGGVAIAVCISHKLADVGNVWIHVLTTGESEVMSPIFDAHIHFPPRDITGFMPNEAYMSKENIVTRRFLFNKSSIAALRREASAAFGPEDRFASRVEVVSAFIWMHMMVMARTRTTKPKQVTAVLAVNLRERMVPQLPVHSFGNLARVAIAAETPVEMEKDYHFLVRQVRNAILEINAEYLKKLQDGPVGDLYFLGKKDKQFQNGEIESCNFSSWCRFPVYEVDFGMGKPTWVCCPGFCCKNTVVMMSTKDGDGIETWVTMKEEDMAMFENDQELLSYAS
ncbi:stemmadenine O-acetyltransferase-like [Quercus lobata]|uniref:stemmadenine O-acetyltransferase-like n=1 Tax=Quercus lobata TaxID=97700 RepID=UPI001246435F|nr:stemmadenine O-acetyltransferase-like [Quercus lobata]